MLAARHARHGVARGERVRHHAPSHRPPRDEPPPAGCTQTDDKDDLTEEVIRDKLKKASGANYDLGSNAGGTYKSQAGGIQASARANYQTLEKESNIGPVVFDKYKKDKNVRALPRRQACWPACLLADTHAACGRRRIRHARMRACLHMRVARARATPVAAPQ